MLGFLSDIRTFFDLVFSLGWWLVMGAGLAFAGGLLRPWLGYPGVALGGAIVMFVAFAGNALDRAERQRIERLEMANAHLQAKKAELEATQKQLTQSLTEELEAQAHNDRVITELNRIIEKTKAACECSVPEEFTDALQSLR